jgi:hypothetical protein
MELAELKGTEKQVKWAKAIRKDRLMVWRVDLDSFQAIELMLSQQSVASWWITSRDKSLKEACSQLQGGAKPVTPDKKTGPSAIRVVSMVRADDEELWETVVTATGFRRSGPTRDMVTGKIVNDASLPF